MNNDKVVDVVELENEVKSLEERLNEMVKGLKKKGIGSDEEIKSFEDEIERKIKDNLYKNGKDIEGDLKKLKILKNGINYGYKKGINKGVGRMVYDLMEGGFKDNEILKKVCDYYKNENSTINCVRWYRNKFLKGDYVKGVN